MLKYQHQNQNHQTSYSHSQPKITELQQENARINQQLQESRADCVKMEEQLFQAHAEVGKAISQN